MNIMDKRAVNHLKRDRVMAGLIDKHGVLERADDGKVDLFTNLAREIIGQQLSGKVADVIWGRVVKLFEDLDDNLAKAQSHSQGLDPGTVLEVAEEKLRKCGVSYAKIKYIKNLAEAVLENKVRLDEMESLSDEDVIREITMVKGIGPWTAEMFLMFTLRRPDVFSLGDLGLRTAVGNLYGVERSDVKKIEEISLRWKPYRSAACRYLWKSLD